MVRHFERESAIHAAKLSDGYKISRYMDNLYISRTDFDRESWRPAQTCMSGFIIISKSELPLCEAIGGPEERCPLNCTQGIKTTSRPSLIRCN